MFYYHGRLETQEDYHEYLIEQERYNKYMHELQNNELERWDNMKLYIEVKGGLVTGVYTDDKEADIEVIICDHDDAEQEQEGDGFEFQSTNNCNELYNNKVNLKNLY